MPAHRPPAHTPPIEMVPPRTSRAHAHAHTRTHTHTHTQEEDRGRHRRGRARKHAHCPGGRHRPAFRFSPPPKSPAARCVCLYLCVSVCVYVSVCLRVCHRKLHGPASISRSCRIRKTRLFVSSIYLEEQELQAAKARFYFTNLPKTGYKQQSPSELKASLALYCLLF